MKKTFYVFAALVAGFAMVACDKDDNGGGSKLPPVDYVMPATVSLSGIDMTYTMSGAKVSKIALDDGMAGVNYAVTHSPNLCTVKFYQANDGENVTAKIVLNASGYAQSATIEYDSDQTVFSRVEFTYDKNKMLTKVVENLDPNAIVTLYEASYKSQDLKMFRASWLGESGDIPYNPSTKVNNCGVDPLYIFAVYGMEAEPYLNAASLAIFCNLLPHPYYLPDSIEVEGQTLDLTSEADAAGRITSYDLGGMFTVGFTY